MDFFLSLLVLTLPVLKCFKQKTEKSEGSLSHWGSLLWGRTVQEGGGPSGQ